MSATTKSYHATDDRALHLSYINDIKGSKFKDSSLRILDQNEEFETATKIQSSIQIIDDSETFQYKVLDDITLQINLLKLVRHNLLFVISVAKSYQGRGASLNDLVQEGNLGLIKAALRYDPTKGTKFITYAVWWIRQGITSFMHDHNRTVTLPPNVINEIRKINKAKNYLEAKYGYADPFTIQWGEGTKYKDEDGNIIEVESLQKLPEKLVTHILPDRAQELENIGSFNVLLDDPAGSNEDGSAKTKMDKMSHTDQHKNIEQTSDACHRIELALKVLSPRNRDVIVSHYGIGMDYQVSKEDLAERYKVTTVTINNIIRVSHEAMRKYLDKLDKFEE